jgi:hypothetical protein
MALVTLSPDQQSQITDLYWSADPSLREVASSLGVRWQMASRYATPLPAGMQCYRCRRDLVVTSRTCLAQGGRLTCPECDTTRRLWGRNNQQQLAIDFQYPSDPNAVIVVTDQRDIGPTVESCERALRHVGIVWDDRQLVISADTDNPAAALSIALAGYPVSTVVITSISSLAKNQGDALRSFFLMIAAGWRVVTAEDLDLREHRCDSTYRRWGNPREEYDHYYDEP